MDVPALILASLLILVTIILTRHCSILAVSMKGHFNNPHISIVYYQAITVPHLHDCTCITFCLTVFGYMIVLVLAWFSYCHCSCLLLLRKFPCIIVHGLLLCIVYCLTPYCLMSIMLLTPLFLVNYSRFYCSWTIVLSRCFCYNNSLEMFGIICYNSYADNI